MNVLWSGEDWSSRVVDGGEYWKIYYDAMVGWAFDIVAKIADATTVDVATVVATVEGATMVPIVEGSRLFGEGVLQQ